MKDKLIAALQLITGTRIAQTLVLALVAKSLVVDPGLTTVLILIPVLAFEGYKMYLASKRPDPVRISAELQKQIETINSKVSALSMSKTIDPAAKRHW